MVRNQPTLSPRDGRSTAVAAPPSPAGARLGFGPAQSQSKTGSTFIFGLAILVAIVLVGRVFDIFLVGFHLPAIICVVSLVACLCNGGVGLLTNRVGMPLLGLIGWMFLATPFSFWKGDSTIVTIYFAFYTLMWLPMAMGPRSIKDINRLILLLAVLNVITVLMTKYDSDGRLVGTGASFSNSEDIGLIAVISLPFWMLVASRVGLFPFRILIGVASTLFLVRIAALTGSRATLLTAFGMGLIYFLQTGVSRKILLIGGAAVGIGLIVATVPATTLLRLATVVDAFGDRKSVAINGNTEAMDSAAARHQLLMDSIRLTFVHPLFGVGPGQFAIYRWTEANAVGARVGYFVTHNAYTEVSSENGIPGLIFFIAILVGTQRTIRIARKLNAPGSHKDWQAGRNIATCLQLSFAGMVICGFFLANAQYILWYLFGGIALALERVTLHRMAEERLQTIPQAAPGLYRSPVNGSRAAVTGVKGLPKPRLRPPQFER